MRGVSRYVVLRAARALLVSLILHLAALVIAGWLLRQAGERAPRLVAGPVAVELQPAAAPAAASGRGHPVPPPRPVPRSRPVRAKKPHAHRPAARHRPASRPRPVLSRPLNVLPAHPASQTAKAGAAEIPAPASAAPASAAPASAAAPPDPAALRSAYLARLRAAIARHQVYPRQARRRGEQGRVVLALLIDQDGAFRELRVRRSSGSPRLDRAALQALRRMGRADPLPPGLGQRQWAISVPLVFRLEGPP